MAKTNYRFIKQQREMKKSQQQEAKQRKKLDRDEAKAQPTQEQAK